MKEILRLKNEGASYDELKSAFNNGTNSKIKWKEQAALSSTTPTPGYQRFVGKKGSLDQRLRAVIAYKRSSLATAEASAIGESAGLTVEEEIELEQMMDSEEGDEDVELEEDEELQYESLILQAIERNKLNEVKMNMAVDQRLESRDRYADKKLEKSTANISIDEDLDRQTGSNSSASTTNSSQEDLYTPARHSWGVFQRPRDISKSFGGGRTISKAEMDKLDEEFEMKQQAANTAQKVGQVYGVKRTASTSLYLPLCSRYH